MRNTRLDLIASVRKEPGTTSSYRAPSCSRASDFPASHRPATQGGVVVASSLGAVKTCDLCGRQAEDAETMTWVTSVENGRRKNYCDSCSRDHLRAIESKLDSEWW